MDAKARLEVRKPLGKKGVAAETVAIHAIASIVAALALTPPQVFSFTDVNVTRCGGGYIALTFDDGPEPETQALLDQLKQNNMRATFFLIGEKALAYPHVAQRIVGEGHDVGNHSFSHPDLTKLTPGEIDAELQHAQSAIRTVTGVTPRFARPPGGGTNEAVLAAFTRAHMENVLWTQDTRDTTGVGAETIFRVVARTQPGGVVTMHSRMPNTAATIPMIGHLWRSFSSPMCSGRLEAGTQVMPVPDGRYFFVRAAPWEAKGRGWKLYSIN
jgi:peptidoglycan/xylan/chitin deacetylase (PgdA/CDA1 family)